MRYLSKNHHEQIKGFVGISLPFNVAEVIDRMGWIYQSFFLRTYTKYTILGHPIVKHWEDIGLLNFEKIKKSKTIREFHHHFTTKIYGFKDTDELLDRFLISEEAISKFKYPAFLMIAKDDPIIPFNTIPTDSIRLNKNLKLLVTERGGHLCWFQGLRPKRWYPGPVFQFLEEIKNKEYM